MVHNNAPSDSIFPSVVTPSRAALSVLPCLAVVIYHVFRLHQEHCVFIDFTVRVYLPGILKNYLKSMSYKFCVGR